MENVFELWPELNWIEDNDLRKKTAQTWKLALERSVLSADDLKRIPFTLLCGPDLKVSFMDHKRAVVHIARDSGKKVIEFFGDELPVNMDTLIAGAFLADVGKLLEYVLDENGNAVYETASRLEDLLNIPLGGFLASNGQETDNHINTVVPQDLHDYRLNQAPR